MTFSNPCEEQVLHTLLHFCTVCPEWRRSCYWISERPSVIDQNHMKGLRLSRLSQAYIALWNLLQISLPQKLFLRRRKFSNANSTLTAINVRGANNLHSVRCACKLYRFLTNLLRASLTKWLFGRLVATFDQRTATSFDRRIMLLHKTKLHYLIRRNPSDSNHLEYF